MYDNNGVFDNAIKIAVIEEKSYPLPIFETVHH